MPKHEHSTDPTKYAALAVYWGHDVTNGSLLSDDNKIVLFDNKLVAQDFIPTMGNGRLSTWSVDGETIYFSPIDPHAINKASIVTNYDVYDLPANHPTLSEARNSPFGWKFHEMWSEWLAKTEEKKQRLQAQA